MPAGLFTKALFVAISCLGVAAISLEVLHYTLRFMMEYAVQIDETTELLYGLMHRSSVPRWSVGGQQV